MSCMFVVTSLEGHEGRDLTCYSLVQYSALQCTACTVMSKHVL